MIRSSAVFPARSLSFRIRTAALAFAAGLALQGCVGTTGPAAAREGFDVIIANGVVYDGSGSDGQKIDVAIKGDRIARMGDLDGVPAARRIDAAGKAVTPGFINMLSWAAEALIHDGRGLSDIKQGVTLEVFGEGWSMGPYSPEMKQREVKQQSFIQYDIPWTTLGEFLDYLTRRGVSPNIASYVGATTLRVKHVGYDQRPPTPQELSAMQRDVALAMEEGAMGVGSSLIYAPAFYADTRELIALVDTAQDYGGSYISHMRSEANRLLEGVDEVIEIARATGASAEIYHLKAAGQGNWGKFDKVLAKIEQARREGIRIGADIYPYRAGATGLNAAMPPWVQEGGHDAWVARLKDAKIRARVAEQMATPSADWENLYLQAGSPDNLIFPAFKNPALRQFNGKTLAEVAKIRGTSPIDTMIDLVIEDNTRVETIYFHMSEDNIVKAIATPWVTFGSDADARAPEGVFLQDAPHPRAYGTFARVLGHYVRDKKVVPLKEAVRRLTSLPADNLKIKDRGLLKVGNYADIVIFDPAKIQDHATFSEPQQLATGVDHVFVNGVQVLENGEHTGAKPGRVVRGPGYRPPGVKPAQ